MLNAFAAAMDALFADPNLGDPAVFTPAGGAAISVRVATRRADAAAEFGAGRFWTETLRVDLRVSEVAAPRPGDRLALGGELFEVQGEPMRDRARLVWTLDLRPVEEAAPDPHEIGGGDGTLFVIAGLSVAGAPVAGGEGTLEVMP